MLKNRFIMVSVSSFLLFVPLIILSIFRHNSLINKVSVINLIILIFANIAGYFLHKILD
jgi:hypothetical protein